MDAHSSDNVINHQTQMVLKACPNPQLVQTSKPTDQTLDTDVFDYTVVTPVTSVKVKVLQELSNAKYRIDGFTHGFKLGHIGTRHSCFTKSCQELPQVVAKRFEK